MQNRIVEISTERVHLSSYRGFLIVSQNSSKIGQVAIDDMAALIIRGYGATFSVNICSKLSEANIPVVICGIDQSPASVIWPINGHHSQGLRMQAQAIAKKPLNKRLWSQIISAKITAQADVLELSSLNCKDLRAMGSRVKSGDPDNLEAQAARRYWQRLLGKDFRRNRHAENINTALNYGYSVLRAATSRSILAAGLHPSLSIKHQSRGDALRLADDLMEPFRPWVDFLIKGLASDITPDAPIELNPNLKQKIVSVLSLDLSTKVGNSPLQLCIDTAAKSLANVYIKKSGSLTLPGPPSSSKMAR